MGGSSMYYININGVNTRVDGDTFETELSTGLSIITISTDLECQGVVKQEYLYQRDSLLSKSNIKECECACRRGGCNRKSECI